MPSYFGKQQQNSDRVSDRYLCINNCGFHQELARMDVRRPRGRLDYQLIYIQSGQIHFDLDGTGLQLGSGSVFLYRPGQPQFYRIQGTPTTFFWIHFTGSAVENMLDFFRSAFLQIGDFPEFGQFCRSYYMDYRLTAGRSELLYEGKLISLFALVADRAAGVSPRREAGAKISKALLAMNSHLTPRLSNDQLAQLCALNKSYFIKLFRQATSLTPQQYYTGLILDKSKALLEATDYSVSEVASLCGVEDSLYFSRLFKKHIGISPTDYRKRL